MAVFTVTTTLDGSSGGTLRQAIEAANNTAGADTIVFSTSLSDDLDLRGDALEITDDLTIDFNDLALERSDNEDRLLTVTGEETSLTINGGTLTGGVADGDGGAILAEGADLTVNGTTFESNAADRGGAIATSDAMITINGATFESNATFDEGGALYLSSDTQAVINDSVFLDNRSVFKSGGAIFSDDNTLDTPPITLTIHNTVFEGNNAGTDGGAIIAFDTDVNIDGSFFNANVANGIDDDVIRRDGDGGAIFAEDSNVSVENTFFTANVSDDLGGAISFFGNSSDNTFNVTNSSFLGNTAPLGGAIATDTSLAHGDFDNLIENSTFSQNVATDRGGAIYNFDGNLTIIGSTISENNAADGGGLNSFGDTATTTNIGSSIIANNTSENGEVDLGTDAINPVVTAFVSLGNNLIGDGTLSAPADSAFINGENGDIVGTADAPIDPGLNDLTITDTGVFYTLADDSLALDVIAAATNISTQVTDQRGDQFLRVADAFVDIGAIENQDPNPSFDEAPSTVSIAEGDDAVALINGTDLADDLFGRELTYVFVDGDNDNASFEIRDLPAAAPTDVLLAFIGESDFEDPTDSDRNNSYLIQVAVQDSAGNQSEVHDLNLTVTDVNEAVEISGLIDGLNGTQGQTAAIDLSDLVITDPEGADVAVDVVLQADAGLVRALETDDVEVNDTFDGQGIILSGTISAIAAYLAEDENVFYTGPDAAVGSDELTVSVFDSTGGEDVQRVDIDIDAASGAITINGGTSGFVSGGSAADTIVTGDDETFVFAGSGDDVVAIVGDNSGASGDDGDDIIGALNGDHFIEGGAGADILVGGIGVDDIDGGTGNDVIKGDVSTFLGEGDVISGGTGDDLIEGGLGADTFIFATNDGSDTIGTIDINFANPAASTVTGSDFESGVDVIELDGAFGYADEDQAFANVSDVGGTAVFSDQGTTITFEGLTTSDLSADDFILA